EGLPKGQQSRGQHKRQKRRRRRTASPEGLARWQYRRLRRAGETYGEGRRGEEPKGTPNTQRSDSTRTAERSEALTVKTKDQFRESANERTGERANERTSERANERTSERTDGRLRAHPLARMTVGKRERTRCSALDTDTAHSLARDYARTTAFRVGAD